jgi:hypothetical protein
MIQTSAPRALTESELTSLRHPWEESRYQLAVVTSLAVLALCLILTITSAGTFLFVIALVAFAVWFATQLLQARLIGNAVRVSPDNFPELFGVLQSVKSQLDYRDPVDMYVVEAGELNAFLYRLFRTRFIVLNSELVTAMTEQHDLTQLRWIVARFIGSLKTKHLRIEYIRILIGALESAQIFNLLLLPYERATQYTGDQIGLALCGDLAQSQVAMLKFVVGKDLAQRVNPPAFIDQAARIRGNFFAWYSQILAGRPHWTSRYLNLLAFARARDHAAFDRYCAACGIDPRRLDYALPDYYPHGHQAYSPAGSSSEPVRWPA